MIETEIVNICEVVSITSVGLVILIISFMLGKMISDKSWSTDNSKYVRYDGDVYKVENKTADFVHVKNIYSSALFNRTLVSDNGPTHMLTVSKPTNLRSVADAIGKRIAAGSDAYLILDIYRLDNKRFIMFCEHKGRL